MRENEGRKEKWERAEPKSMNQGRTEKSEKEKVRETNERDTEKCGCECV